MTLPTAVDLRSAYERVYNQGPDPACGPFAVCNAADCIWERATGKTTRFDPHHVWDWSRWHMGLAGVKTGSTFDSLERATRLNGMYLGNDPVTGFRLVRTWVADTRYVEVKHLLAMGVPVVWEMKVTQGMYDLGDKRDWRTHEISRDTSSVFGQHYVCIVGYDDTAQRWLVENSWGPDWADGGFFGVPYDSFQALSESLQHFNVTPINPKPVEGYTVPAVMFTAEKAAFVDRSKDTLRQHLMDTFAAGGAQALIAECVKWGVSDKHLEAIAGWQRGAVRAYQADNQGLNWEGFVWDQH